jgi:hypothetical protein
MVYKMMQLYDKVEASLMGKEQLLAFALSCTVKDCGKSVIQDSFSK